MGINVIELSSDDSRNSDDSVINLPPVELNSSKSSASSSKSGSQPTTTVKANKRRKKVDANNEAVSKKSSKVTARSTKKQRLAEEKAVKKRTQEINKIYKPGECMKYMKVEMHPTLLEKWYMQDVEREVTMAGAKIVPSTEVFNPGLVMWKRSVPPTLVSRDGQIEMTPPQERCDRGLYVMTAEEAATYVREHSLPQHVGQIREVADLKLTLVIFGTQEYYRSAGKKTKDNNAMTELNLDMAITDLLVSTGCDSVLVEQSNELALLVVQFTKAIGEAPYKISKRALDEQAEFYMRGDNKKCVPVDKDGNGLSRLWQQMIAVLPQCSLETSRALCAEYKTPLSLYEALQSPDGVQKVAELGVSRAALPGCRSRRIGPEFARKLHTLFTAEDGNTLIE